MAQRMRQEFDDVLHQLQQLPQTEQMKVIEGYFPYMWEYGAGETVSHRILQRRWREPAQAHVSDIRGRHRGRSEAEIQQSDGISGSLYRSDERLHCATTDGQNAIS